MGDATESPQAPHTQSRSSPKVGSGRGCASGPPPATDAAGGWTWLPFQHQVCRKRSQDVFPAAKEPPRAAYIARLRKWRRSGLERKRSTGRAASRWSTVSSATASTCRSGACHSCLVKVVDGPISPVAQLGLKETWKQQQLCMACVSTEHADVTVALSDTSVQVKATVVVLPHLRDVRVARRAARLPDVVYVIAQTTFQGATTYSGMLVARADLQPTAEGLRGAREGAGAGGLAVGVPGSGVVARAAGREAAGPRRGGVRGEQRRTPRPHRLLQLEQAGAQRRPGCSNARLFGNTQRDRSISRRVSTRPSSTIVQSTTTSGCMAIASRAKTPDRCPRRTSAPGPCRACVGQVLPLTSPGGRPDSASSACSSRASPAARACAARRRCRRASAGAYPPAARR